VVAFALLAIGVIAGVVVRTMSWNWALPVGGFAGYVLAFRQGLLEWKREGIDGIWRDGLGPVRKPDVLEDATPPPRRQGIETRALTFVRGRFADRRRGRLPGPPHQL
jgi:hypothetical protein